MRTYIISELCGQWGGSTARAKQMITQSKQGGADAVKVQLSDTYRMPGEERERWEYLMMSREQFLDLKEYAESLELDFFASAFHEDRFRWILESGLGINKIASMLLNHDFELCKRMVSTGVLTYCSLGRWDSDEYPFEDKNVKYMHCVSKYPHPLKEAIKLMPSKFDNRLIGYSDHTVGIEACKEAVLRGATVLEKHYTINHDLQSKTEGAHVCSMNMEELSLLREFCEGNNNE